VKKEFSEGKFLFTNFKKILTMNKKLQKQIKAYAGVAGILLAADKSNGQVVYVDINPDTLVTGMPLNSGYHYFFLDVDTDSVNDLKFRVHNQSASSFFARDILISPLNSNQIGNKSYFGSSVNYWPAKLNLGDTISPNGQWLGASHNGCIIGSASLIPSSMFSGCGVWGPGSDNYLTFRWGQISNYYYGWLRIEVLTKYSFLLKEYAYNTIPNVQLRAGYTVVSTGISESNSQFNFTQQNNSIHISSFQKLNHANISVYDLLGKEILQQTFEGKETTITISKKGIYFVEVKSEKGIFRKKIFIY
jgi:type IX secretion system substrate protein